MNLNSYRINYPNNVYFTAMKKNQFYGIDRACVDKFAPPIEKFNTNDDLQTWAKQKRDEIIYSNYPSAQAWARLLHKIEHLSGFCPRQCGRK